MTEDGKACGASSFRRWLGAALVLAALSLLLWHGFFRTVEAIDTAPVRRGSIENTVSALAACRTFAE